VDKRVAVLRLSVQYRGYHERGLLEGEERGTNSTGKNLSPGPLLVGNTGRGSGDINGEGGLPLKTTYRQESAPLGSPQGDISERFK